MSRLPLTQPELVLFDAGGTLVHIDPGRFNALLERMGHRVIDPAALTEAHYRAMWDYSRRLAAGKPVNFSWWVARFFEGAGVTYTPALEEAFDLGRGMWNRPIGGARRAVQGIRARGCRVAVVSNSDGSVAESLRIAGFDGLFEEVIDSHDVGISKPNPEIFTIALERLGVAPADTWHVGDSPHHDIGGAVAAGLAQAVLVDPLGLGPPDQLSVRSVSDLLALMP